MQHMMCDATLNHRTSYIVVYVAMSVLFVCYGAGGNWATAGRGKMKRQRERGLSRVGMSGLVCDKRVSARMKGEG